MSHDALKRALAHFDDNQSEFARVVGCSQQMVSYWMKRGRPIAPEFAIPVEQATGISRHELRPDIYPVESKAA